jgi:hypothetical protein
MIQTIEASKARRVISVEELLAERRLDLSYETVRCWVIKSDR